MCARTLIRFSYILVFFLCVPFSAFAATNVTTDIDTNTHWTLGGSPYVVNFTDNDEYFQHLLTVTLGVTLTIDPGVVVKFGAYNGIRVKGTLQAEGTTNSPIIFTSLQDDTVGGDTNGDGVLTTSADEQWMHIEFSNGSNGTFDNTIVRYGGAPIRYVFNTGIENYGGTLSINHTTLTHNGYDGLGQRGGHTTLTNSLISNQSVGINMNGGVLDMSDTRIHDNGSGIDHSDGTLSITHSEIDHNGAGIVAESQGSITVSNSSIHDNSNGMYDNESQISIDARNNWWGDASGPRAPYNPNNNTPGFGSSISANVIYSPWLTSNPFTPPDPCIAAGNCVSNVLFLPGIEGSRLYEGVGCGKAVEEKLWEPLGDGIVKILRGAGDAKVENLFLDDAGESVCSDIYTKENDIIDSAGGSNIYKSFINEMNGLKTDGTIADWKPAAYDWRLSLTDLLSKGAERDGNIYYEEATSTPYIEQTLRALAASSKTGKVSIVAHSNGGLVAKALLNQLGSSTSKLLVDKVIMVGVPQSGAPVDVGALLYGYDQGISSHGIPILHSDVARTLAQNSPMAYHLLPSEDYLESTAGDSIHPVIRFSGAGYAKEEAAYGSTIANRVDLAKFLLASTTLNSTLIDYATSTHATLDFWTPPSGIEVDQIAGWGADTVAGIDFYTPPPINVFTAFNPARMYRPIFTEDGDGTVTVPSAIMMATTPGVNRYWIDLHAYNNDLHLSRNHKDLLEIPSLQDFIKNIVKNSTSTLPTYIVSSQPASSSGNKKLTFFLHSPLTLQLTDSSGNVTGLTADGSISQDISGSSYGEFGDVKYVTVPQGSSYTLTMHGQDTGSFSLDMQESSGGVITASSTIASVPATASTLASLTISGGIDTASALTVDENGDGKNIIAIHPEVGKTVNYEPPAPVPEPVVSSSGSGGGRVSILATTLAPVAITTATNSLATTTSATAIPSPRSPVATHSIPKRLPPPATIANTIPNFSQIASVYEASQQSVVKKIGVAVYTNLYRIWRGLKIIFHQK